MGPLAMVVLGCLLLYLALGRRCDPRILLPLGFGVLVSNASAWAGWSVVGRDFLWGTAPPSTAAEYLCLGVVKGYYAPLLFLGLGVAADFSPLLARPRLFLAAVAGPIGILVSFVLLTAMGLGPEAAVSASLVGAGDGPVTFFVSSALAPYLVAPATLAAFLWAGLAPLVQEPIARLCSRAADRQIRTLSARLPTRAERVLFPIVAFVVCGVAAPRTAPLLGLFFLGNLLRESGAVDAMVGTLRSAFTDAATILAAGGVGLSATAEAVLSPESFAVFAVGGLGICAASAAGVLLVRAMNAFGGEPLNPLLGLAGVSALPESARLVQVLGAREEPTSFLLCHARGVGTAGAIGVAVTAGVLWALFSV